MALFDVCPKTWAARRLQVVDSAGGKNVNSLAHKQVFLRCCAEKIWSVESTTQGRDKVEVLAGRSRTGKMCPVTV